MSAKNKHLTLGTPNNLNDSLTPITLCGSPKNFTEYS
jgi:hypothetical protein